jgi:hypothetical protein
MKSKSVSIELEEDLETLTIRIPVQKPRPSASGKTLVIASTRGCKSGKASYSGRPIVVAASAWIYPEANSECQEKTFNITASARRQSNENS